MLRISRFLYRSVHADLHSAIHNRNPSAQTSTRIQRNLITSQCASKFACINNEMTSNFIPEILKTS